MKSPAFVLRKIGGTFDACLHEVGRWFSGAGRGPSGPSLLGVAALFVAVLLVPLVLVAAVAAVIAHPLHVAAAHAHVGHSLLGLAGIAGTTEVKKLVEDLKGTFEQFKERDQQREDEAKKLGSETAETKAAQEKLNTRLDEIELQIKRAHINRGLEEVDNDIRESKAKRSFGVKAFSKWVRRGIKGVNDEEQKSLATQWYDDGEEVKALQTDSDVEGGAFVPHQLANRVIQKLILVSPFRALATVETISSNALEIPAEGAQNFAAGWVGERATRSNTQTAQIRMERIPAHEMYAQPIVSQTQLDDSAFDVETWMSGRVATIMAQLEGQGFLKGTANAQPEGVVNNSQIPAGQQLSIANGSFTGSAAADQLITMWSTLPTFYANAASWILNRATLGVIRKLKDNNNQYLWQPGGFGVALQNGFPATILGQPYAEMPDMDSVGAGKYPILFGNFKAAYTIVDRIGMRVIRDNLTQKPFVLFYTTKRVGGQVVLGEAIVQLKTT